MEAGHPVYHHVKRVSIADNCATEQKGKDKLDSGLDDILNLSEDTP